MQLYGMLSGLDGLTLMKDCPKMEEGLDLLLKLHFCPNLDKTQLEIKRYFFTRYKYHASRVCKSTLYQRHLSVILRHQLQASHILLQTYIYIQWLIL